MESKALSLEQIAQYQRDGYLVIKQFCSDAEIEKLYSTALNDDAMRKNDCNDALTGCLDSQPSKLKASASFRNGNARRIFFTSS